MLNGARDKAEILDVWRRAAQVVAPALRLPAWGSRCNLDNIVSVLRHAFDEVSPPDRLPGVFRFPTAEPPLAWIDSLRAGTKHLVSDRTWQDLLGEARRLIDDHIERTGIFEVRKESGVVVAKTGFRGRSGDR